MTAILGQCEIKIPILFLIAVLNDGFSGCLLTQVHTQVYVTFCSLDMAEALHSMIYFLNLPGKSCMSVHDVMCDVMIQVWSTNCVGKLNTM